MKRLASLSLIPLLVLVPVAATCAADLSFPDDGSRFWVDAREGWWTDVVILSDGAGSTDVLRALAPDALSWAFYGLPSYLAELGTRHVGSTDLGYQESLELEPDELEGWEFESSLAHTDT